MSNSSIATTTTNVIKQEKTLDVKEKAVLARNPSMELTKKIISELNPMDKKVLTIKTQFDEPEIFKNMGAKSVSIRTQFSNLLMQSGQKFDIIYLSNEVDNGIKKFFKKNEKNDTVQFPNENNTVKYRKKEHGIGHEHIFSTYHYMIKSLLPYLNEGGVIADYAHGFFCKRDKYTNRINFEGGHSLFTYAQKKNIQRQRNG